MQEKIKALFVKYKKTIFQFIKFNFIGIANTLIDWGIFALLNSGFELHRFVVKPISFTCGLVNSYFLNKFWAFKKKEQGFRGMELVRFLIVNLVTLGASMLAMEFLKTVLGINPTLANILVTPVAFLINFLCYKFWVFKTQEKEEPDKKIAG